MDHCKLIGMDTSKRYVQLHGVDASERPILRKTLPRERMIAFSQALPATVVALEACGASHHWSRVLGVMEHTIKLIAPQLAKPYVRRGKNDAADAEALCEAASRPSMRFVAAKTAEQQAQLMLATARERLVSQRTQIANAIRGHAAEFGLTAAKGTSHIAPLLAIVQADAAVPALARKMLAGLACDYAHIEARLAEVEAELRAGFKSNAMARKLTVIPGIGPGIGPVAASLLVMKIPDPHAFETGRDLAAWIGLTPRDHSTAGKTRLGRITRAGDETLRSVLVVGATSVIRHARTGHGQHKSAWSDGRSASGLDALLTRKPPKLAAVAQVNKTARVAWKLMISDGAYVTPPAQPKLAAV